jgi:hypothetical protein
MFTLKIKTKFLNMFCSLLPGVETKVLDPRLKFWLPSPKCQIKRHDEGRERRFITQIGTYNGKRCIPSSITSMVWFIIISVFVLEEVLKLLSGFLVNCQMCPS